ncbi:DUF3054 domain-containing protein [Propionibacteriaceae bacterium Y1923]|uniref:DUF3054 domain-containing protein n=1 Tax=Aestuariimicrobium sp. Y1814 TaxID=3418742 RepID=UPI003C13B24B
MGKQYAIVVDLALVVVFAVIGRASHGGSLGPGAIFGTAWPFLTACLVAWAVMLIRKRDHLGIGAGIFVWFITWAGGMFFRVSGGDTAAIPFVVVAAAVLALFLVGWRVLAGLLARRNGAAAKTAAGSVADQ